MLEWIFSWQCIALFISGVGLSILNSLGIRQTIKALLRNPERAKQILIVSFLSRGVLTAIIIVILMARSLRRALAIMLGFTIAKIIDVMYLKMRALNNAEASSQSREAAQQLKQVANAEANSQSQKATEQAEQVSEEK